MNDTNGGFHPEADEMERRGGDTPVQNCTDRSVTNLTRRFELSGTLLWVTTDGEPRELASAGESTRDGSVLAVESGSDGEDVSCRRCGSQALAEAIVREHIECGRVSVDGFVRDGGRFGCPKCGAEAELIDRFQTVATTTACLACGDLLPCRSDA